MSLDGGKFEKNSGLYELKSYCITIWRTHVFSTSEKKKILRPSTRPLVGKRSHNSIILLSSLYYCVVNGRQEMTSARAPPPPSKGDYYSLARARAFLVYAYSAFNRFSVVVGINEQQ